MHCKSVKIENEIPFCMQKFIVYQLLYNSMANVQKLIDKINDTIKNPDNMYYLACGQFKDVYNFLKESYDCLYEYTKNKMSYNEVIEYLDLCPNNPVFVWNCSCDNCEELIRKRKQH